MQQELIEKAEKGVQEPAVSQGDPVAWMWQHDETGRTGFVEASQLQMGWQEANLRLQIVAPLYTAQEIRKITLERDLLRDKCQELEAQLMFKETAQEAGLTDSRARFELDWAKRHYPIPMNTRTRDDGRYGDYRIQSEWEAFQAGEALRAKENKL